MSATPTSRGAHCSQHATHRGACAGCQRASIAAAQQQLALVSKQTIPDLPDRRSPDKLESVAA